MNNKVLLLTLGLILFPLCCYLEWGGSNSMFLYQFEARLLMGQWSKDALMHPAVLFPVAGQLLLIVSLFAHKYKYVFLVVGTMMLSLLVYFIFFIGVMSASWKITLSALPFVITSCLFWWKYRMLRKKNRPAL